MPENELSTPNPYLGVGIAVGVINPDYKLTDVDTRLIDNAVNSIEEDIKELLSISVILSGSTMINLDPYWQGPAKNSFEKQFTAFYEDFDKYVGNCKALNEQLKSSGSTYRSADDSVKQLIAGIRK